LLQAGHGEKEQIFACVKVKHIDLCNANSFLHSSLL